MRVNRLPDVIDTDDKLTEDDHTSVGRFGGTPSPNFYVYPVFYTQSITSG